MIKPLLIAVAAASVAGGAVAGVYYAVPREEEEVLRPAALETATPASTPTAITTRTPTPVASPSTVPADWAIYTDPGGLFTVRYPPNWFQSGPSFSSYDLSTLTTTRPPPEAVEVEVGYYEAVGSSGCGALSVDPKTGEGSPEAGATPATLGGLPAWQIVRVQGDPAISEENFTRIQGISVIYKGYCFLIAAYFKQQNPDVATFEEIASSFSFSK